MNYSSLCIDNMNFGSYYLKMKKHKIVLVALILITLGIILTAGFYLITAIFDRTNLDTSKVITRLETASGDKYWRITAGPANAWLITTPEGYLLIDTGYPIDYVRFKEGMDFAGLDINKIQYLFITHAHDEHAGFAAKLKKETDCILILPKSSLDGLASGRFDWKGETVNPIIHALGILYNTIKARDFRFEPIIPAFDDIILFGKSSELLRELSIDGTLLATPGHTDDSWSLIHDDGRAFVGDAAMNTLNTFGAGFRPIFMEDRTLMYESLDLIRKNGAKIILSGHGDPFSAELLPNYRELASVGPGIASLPNYFSRLMPGFILLILLLVLVSKVDSIFRIWLYIIGFILMRDLMTPLEYWSFGSDPVFWIRFAADGPLLIILAIGSLIMSLLIIFYENKRGVSLTWFRESPLQSILAGIAGAIVVVLPLVLMYVGILSGERGGLVPRSLIPAILSIALAGNLLEELLFRGYLQNWFLKQGMNPVKSALSSGLLFALCHVFLAYTVTNAGLPLIIFAFWEGTLCGLIKNRFGLSAAVLTHGLAIAIMVTI